MKKMTSAAFAAVLLVLGASAEAESLVVDADAEITVEAGVTNSYVFLAGSKSATLTKKGAGVLEFLGVQNKKAKIVVEEGEVAFRKPPRPDEVFANAYLHLDASDASTLVTETVNGTNFVIRWNDADGRAICATNSLEKRTWRPNPENRRAFLSYDKTDVGLPVVDLGEPTLKENLDEDGVAIGYGAALLFAFTTSSVCAEFFTVTQDHESLKSLAKNGAGPSFIGNINDEMHGRRGSTVAGKNPTLFTFWSSNEGSQRCYYGTNAIDCASASSGSNYPDGFHVLDSRPTKKILANALGRTYRKSGASCDTFGGIRYGEVLILSDQLDGVTRTNVTAYLMAKWERYTVASVRVCAGARASVDEGLHYDFTEYVQEDGDDVSVCAGRNVSFDTLGSLDVYGWFDAADTNSLEIEARNGTNFVTRWNSQNDATLFATNFAGTADAKSKYRPDPENRIAYVTTGATVTGLPVVDFGSYLSKNTSQSGGDKDGSEGYGASMVWSKRGGNNVAEFFTVAADDTGRPFATGSSTRGVQSYLGCANNNANGLRGSGGTLFEYWDALSPSKPTSVDAKWVSLDGVEVPYNTARPSAGFHVINNVPGEKICGDAFAHTHRNTTFDTYGGLKIAEVIELKTAIDSPRHRAFVNQYLLHKWLGEPAGVRTYRNVEVQPGASLDVVLEPVEVSGTLALAGTLKAKAVTAANVAVTAAGAAVDGDLALGELPAFSFAQVGETAAVTSVSVGTLDLGAAPGTITVSVANAKALRGQKAKLIDFGSVVGTLDGWTVESNYDMDVSVTLEADGIYATFGKPGALLILR